MTKKHFIIVAEELRNCYQQAITLPYQAAIRDIVDRFATRFKLINPNFDEKRFRKFIGLPPGE